jgi:hypothetical protein
MRLISNFGPALAAALFAFAPGCGGRAESQDAPIESTPEQPAVGTAVQAALDGLANAYRALCACEAARSSDGSCDAKEEFEGYDPDAVREALERHAERGDGFTECIRDIVQPLSACLSAVGGCDSRACPHAGALLDDNMVLDELGESCPRPR